jgi:hypothetical protein
MEPKMIKFPSIEPARRVLPRIISDAQFTHIDPETNTPCYDASAPLPVLEFRGTVKLHGSNAAIVQSISPDTGENSIHFQSRERILATGKDDLIGFCAYMSGQMKAIKNIFESILVGLESFVGRSEEIENIAVFGEWCGAAIQKGVALSHLPKMFVIFAVRIIYQGDKPDEWIDMSKLSELKDEDARIFNILLFPTFTLTINFNKEESIVASRKQMEELTQKVEEECPVGRHFGISGTGEGIVWQAVNSSSPSAVVAISNSTDPNHYSDPRFWFKTKGVKHTTYRKPAARAAVISVQSKADIETFVEFVVTEGRLEQGFQFLEREMVLPLEMTSGSAFMKWVRNDVLKEEDDRIEAERIEKKALEKAVGLKAKRWFIERVAEENLKRSVA